MRTKKIHLISFVIFSLIFVLFTACSSHYVEEQNATYVSQQLDRQYEKEELKSVVQPKKIVRQTIVIDAGHGGYDDGTSSAPLKYQEKKLTLQTAQLIKKYLEEMGYRVIMTRQRDEFISLDKRVAIANQIPGRLFVSMHYNYAENKKAHGIEIHYYDAKQNSKKTLASKKLAEKILGQVVHFTGAKSRGIKNSNLAVIRKTNMEAVLVEGGFLSNPQERQKLKSHKYLESLAWGVASGIDNYLKTL